MSEQTANPNYSIILPVFNEEDCLEETLNQIDTAMNPLGQPLEIICVDDGSSDKTWPIIQKAHQSKPYIKGVKFPRNFGHQLAVLAGIRYSKGEYIAVLDADGQDPPGLLPKFFEKCQEGYDVVYAIRKDRKENIFKKAAYKLFYVFYKAIVPFDVPLDSGDFSVFNRKVADFIRSLDEKNPFLRGLRSWHGGKQIGLEYERQKRAAGKPKYNLHQLILLAINASISFSKIPLRFISILGITISIISFIGGILLLIMKLTVGIDALGWTSTALLIIFFGGLNLFVLGIIGEYIGEIFNEVKNRPAFLIDQTVGI